METELQYSLAEIGIAIMGFSGLIVVFRRKGSEAWSAAELTALWILTSNGLAIAFFALLPVLVHGSGSDDVWSICQTALGGYLSILAVASIWSNIRSRSYSEENRVPVISHILIFFSAFTPFLAAALLISGLSGWLVRAQWFYSGALVAGVVVAGLQFLYFVALMSRARG